MIHLIRLRLTFANVTSLLALFIALGGSSYAALNLPKGSVGAKQLRNNAVSSPKVKPGSLLLSDFRRSQRTALRGPRGPQGPQGVQGTRGEKGEKGDPGTQGAPGLSGYTRVVLNTSPSSSTSPQNLTVPCPPNTKVIGAAADVSGGKTGSAPNIVSNVVTEVFASDTSVSVEGYESTATNETWFIFGEAICARVE